MGKLIDFFEHKNAQKPQPSDGIHMQIAPPFVVVRHFEKGAVVKEERVISEFMLRELLDGMHG